MAARPAFCPAGSKPTPARDRYTGHLAVCPRRRATGRRYPALPKSPFPETDTPHEQPPAVRTKPPVLHVRAGWSDLILVCRKCSRRIDGGFGPDGDERLARILKRRLNPRTGGKGKPRKQAVGVIETGCLDICPKNGVVVVRHGALDDWLVIRKGMPVDAILALLGYGPEPAGGPHD